MSRLPSTLIALPSAVFSVGRIVSKRQNDRTGQVWGFDGLAPGKYHLRFEYVYTKEGDKFWAGKATTNDVEFEVAAPEGAKPE